MSTIIRGDVMEGTTVSVPATETEEQKKERLEREAKELAEKEGAK